MWNNPNLMKIGYFKNEWKYIVDALTARVSVEL